MKFVYIGRINLPQDAASIRVYNVGEILKTQGHQVDYICQEGSVPGGEIVHEESRYYGVLRDGASKAAMCMEWLFGNGAVRRFKKLLKKESYDGVVLYNAPITTAKKILRVCRKRRIAVINDVTEWYEISRSKGLVSCAVAWLVDRRIRLLDHKCDGVIAISRYLEDYYKEKVASFNLPPVFEGNGTPNTSVNAVPRFLYAGSPSKKDELYNFIEAVKAVNSEKIRVEMTIIGAPIPEDSAALTSKGIHYLPRMPHAAVLQALGEHDFTVILRRDARYAKAGYSTKVAESLHNGTPVFCNEIGGADIDIQSGFNGVKICLADVDTIKNELLRIIRMPPEEMAQMKRNALSFGKEKYCRVNYEDMLNTFFAERVSQV